MVIEVGRKYRTRGGSLARVICADMKDGGGKRTVAALAENQKGAEMILHLYSNGRWHGPLEIVSEFDLVEEILPSRGPIRMDKTYHTRLGNPARVLCVDAPGMWPVIFLALYAGEVAPLLVRASAYGLVSDHEHPEDLIEDTPEPKKRFINLYQDQMYGRTYDTQREAILATTGYKAGCIAAGVEVTYTEGEGL